MEAQRRGALISSWLCIQVYLPGPGVPWRPGSKARRALCWTSALSQLEHLSGPLRRQGKETTGQTSRECEEASSEPGSERVRSKGSSRAEADGETDGGGSLAGEAWVGQAWVGPSSAPAAPLAGGVSDWPARSGGGSRPISDAGPGALGLSPAGIWPRRSEAGSGRACSPAGLVFPLGLPFAAAAWGFARSPREAASGHGLGLTSGSQPQRHPKSLTLRLSSSH